NLVYSTFLGGTNNDVANHIAVDNNGGAYVTGWTVSTNFPSTATNLIANYLTNNIHSAVLTTNVFLTKITNGISPGIAYSAVFGGNRSDIGFGVAVDSIGNAFVAGAAFSTNFPTFNTSGFLRATNSAGKTGTSDVFVTAFNTNASALLYSVYLGGRQNDYGYGIALDPLDSAYVVGQTASTNFPTLDAFQSKRDGTNDTFLAKILLTNAPPVLGIDLNGKNILLSRSAYQMDYAIEETTDLTSTNWGSVQAQSVFTNGLQITTFPVTNYDRAFFRLHKF
ncbi:MAG: SBBP repeat-containing protein, partial [Limisphaerales bacterium]